MAVTTQRLGRVLVVTLDRPEARNAFDGETITALREVFETVAGQPEPTVDVSERPHVVLLQTTGPVFCAGADLAEMKRLGQADVAENLTAAREMGAMFRAIRLSPAPVLARVQGPAFGGGVGLICACDLVVASDKARFAFSEVRLGLVPGVIAPLVMERIGTAPARYHFLTGEPFSALEAQRIGLVDRLVAPEVLDQAVKELIQTLLKGGPAALGRVKRLVEGTLARGFEQSLEFTAGEIAVARTAAEAQAALTAFFAKEPAAWARQTGWPPEGDA